jgi:hypothetical protein
MKANVGENDEIRFPYSGQLEIEIYFKEYKDNCANDCRRFLHKGEKGNAPLIEALMKKLKEEETTFTIFPKDYALLRHVPTSIDAELKAGSNRFGAGKTRGGLEIYDVSGLERCTLNKLKEVLEEKRKNSQETKLPWFSYYRIYLREELL